ncbi:SH3 domain-containing protein [Propioniciclava sp.]|uniref:SH3 domain-containing protein n=1 Tax=Propioniciclava sp. TaxID=2038686 RepID=UPI00261CB493|nr:SH3 domain-containing protein [Propioniciclava sp.]
MYQPRRVSDVQPESFDQVAADSAFISAPRRRAVTRMDLLRTRVAPTALSAVLLFGVTAFAVNLNAQGATDTTVAAPARVDDTTSRSTERTEAEASALVSEAATDEASATTGTDPVAEGAAAGTDLVAEGAAAGTDPVAEDAAAGTDPVAEDATAETQEVEGDGAAATFAVGSWENSFGKIVGDKYAQAKVTVRADASSDADSVGTLNTGDKLAVTDSVVNGFRQVNFDGKIGWVADSRLGDSAPAQKTAAAGSGSSASSESYTGATSYSGKTVLGLKPKAMVVYNAVTAKWSFTSIGGYRASSLSNHQLGGAIDFMTFSDSSKGWEVANYLAANADAFNIDHIIFQQKIWTPYKPYWRGMANRGSATANHMDHVHVSVKL